MSTHPIDSKQFTQRALASRRVFTSEHPGPPRQFIRRPQVEELLCRSTAWIYGALDLPSPLFDPRMPKQVHLAENGTVVWILDEVLAYMEILIAEGRKGGRK